MDESGVWNWWECKPKIEHNSDWWWTEKGDLCCLSDAFDIAPVDDWTKSLMKVG